MIGEITYFGSVVFYLGIGMNTLFVLLSLWGMIAFFPRRAVRGNNAAAWLILAIWLGFLGVGLNVFYWRVFGDLTIRYGIFTVSQISEFGRYYGDFLWKGIGCVSIYLHFFARWKSIPPEEQGQWSPLLMGFYPDLSHWAVRMGNRMQTLYRIKRKEDA